ncbi:MAG: DUF885 domain-containing protein, partial [Pseudobdellovibrionaceae bacterium]
MKFKSFIFSFLMMISLSNLAQADYQKNLDRILKSSQSNSAKLDALFKVNWDYTMKTYPEWATYLGYPGQNHRWTDASDKAWKVYQSDAKATLKAIQSISKKGLSAEQVLSYELFLKEAQRTVEGFKYPSELLPIHQMGGIHIDIPDLLWNAPKNSLKDYQDMIQRLKTSPVVISQVQALLEKGLSQGIVPPKIVLKSVPQLMDTILTEKITESSLYAPFQEIKGVFSDAEKKQIQDEALSAIQNHTYPALKSLREYLVKTYIPQSRDSVGFSDLKNGSNWYNYKIKGHTTVNLTADQIHELGLSEVKRIETEMIKIKDEMKFKGELKAFNQFLKTDKQFFFDNPKDLMTAYRDIAKRVDPEIPKLFGKLPRLTYGVREMPSYKAPSAPTAYYQGGSLSAGRAGSFEANTYDLKARPKWQMEA